MERWQQQLKESITSPDELGRRFGLDPVETGRVASRYPLRITPYYLDLIQEQGDPIWRQCVPDGAELVADEDLADPLDEEALSPVPAIVHRYPDRVLFLVSGTCATYCRFCTRKRKVGCPSMRVSFQEVLDGIAYIAKTPGVRDVLLSGGDPLMMSDLLLEDILGRLRAIPHVEIIRIGTRMPVTLPDRITDGLCKVLRRFAPLYLNTHFNHPRELTPAAAEACRRLADAGVVLGNQTVLLKGVNDDAEVMAELFRGLLRLRVRPYYLHHMDLVSGTRHFRTRVEKGIDILKALRGQVSGLAIPHYVIDLPGGRGKVPVLPDYVEKMGDELLIRTGAGELVRFPNDCSG
ncbi:KamA family radical SAM protein [Desulfuromonas sp. AOP6]|uniref:KamA family radical SAM protein n=1 Tax=Desulfuromonas sp. AOP6 TaxID=1566351 RepID=UPI0012712225|nr:KamA family radical SAM protein [Desulfuromonas sp. AOP6]BCA80372.1 lysine 2,3-aminomutase [Desulfuromonas sp. AOP6]